MARMLAGAHSSFLRYATTMRVEPGHLRLAGHHGTGIRPAPDSPEQGGVPTGDRTLRLLIPLCAFQLFLEALRQDDYPRLASNAFIRVNQVLALAFLLVIAIMLTRRLGARRALPLWGALLLAVAAAIAAEFNEKLPIAREALYGLSLAAQALLSMVMLRAVHRAISPRQHPADAVTL